MAPRNNEQSEREINVDINSAIAGTEDEIFREAMEADLDDNDADNSLEEMGEGLEGDHLDEDDIVVDDTEGPADAEDDGDEEDDEDADDDGEVEEGDEEDEEEEGEETDEEPRRDARGRFDRQEPRIPPGRLREQTERARRAEQERDTYRTQVTTLEARFNDLLQRVNTGQVGPAGNKTQQQEQTAPKPDMFTDPDGYEAWVLEQAETRASARIDARLADRDRQVQQDVNDRVDRSFNEAATGPRSFEFMPAYNALKGLDPKDPQGPASRAWHLLIARPQAALFDWWDQNGGQDFRDNVARQLGYVDDEPRRQRRDDGGRQQPTQQRGQQQRQVRHEIRGPRSLRSLNGASGGIGQNRVSDPEMFDGSEDSVFRFATQR